jgi:cytochrome b6-f complex iron-sulfur subunit
VCTHEGCTVSNSSGSNFACPCHGSQYTTSGSVAKGPAASSLRSFPATFDGTTLTFTG